ncbi:MAG: hypothetical protein HY021_16670 [Burkholderiales bacterium]|nr:hypothetical protein [Burkholderiales bacterium]
MNKHVITLAALAALSGCGGGDGAERASITPAAAVSALRAKILAVSDTAVSPEEAARQLLDFAEASVYKSYFPTHETTQSFPPFLFRYYPGSGIYLGVVVTANPTYTNGGVYVMGGAFGSAPLYVGQLTAFITPVAPGGGTAGANNGCYDLALADTVGTHLVLTFQYSGPITGAVTVDSTTGPLTPFEGNTGYETLVKTISNTFGIGGSSGTIEIKTYGRRTGDAELTQYGNTASSTISVSGQTGTITSKGVYTPPYADRSAGIALGSSLSQTSTQTTTSTTVIPGFPVALPPTINTSSQTTVTKYAANETVTVPAGTFSTCRYELSFPATPNTTTTQWIIRGKGIPVQILSKTTGQTDSLQQATAITLNGAAVH